MNGPGCRYASTTAPSTAWPASSTSSKQGVGLRTCAPALVASWTPPRGAAGSGGESRQLAAGSGIRARVSSAGSGEPLLPLPRDNDRQRQACGSFRADAGAACGGSVTMLGACSWRGEGRAAGGAPTRRARRDELFPRDGRRGARRSHRLTDGAEHDAKTQLQPAAGVAIGVDAGTAYHTQVSAVRGLQSERQKGGGGRGCGRGRRRCYARDERTCARSRARRCPRRPWRSQRHVDSSGSAGGRRLSGASLPSTPRSACRHAATPSIKLNAERLQRRRRPVRLRCGCDPRDPAGCGAVQAYAAPLGLSQPSDCG